jgi:predicted NBD/HSP70 family sugar kinase
MAKVTAGVDLGGTKIQTVVLDGRKVVGSARVLTPQTGAADVMATIAATVKASLDQAGSSIKGLQGLGIGTPGEIDAADGVVSLAANVPGFTNRVELGLQVSRSLGNIPVRIDNDVRVATLGEFRRGAGRPHRNFLGVFVGTGVGGGLVLEGKLREGRGAAGEIGHTVVKDGGRTCSCGRRGCLEAYAGRARMELRARQLVKSGRKTVLFDIMRKKGRDRLSSGIWYGALQKGDKMAKSLIDDAVWALGVALASAQNLLDLEAIVVGGGLGDRLGKPFVDRVAKAMHPHLFVDAHPPTMLTTELGDLSGAVGAAVLARSGS